MRPLSDRQPIPWKQACISILVLLVGILGWGKVFASTSQDTIGDLGASTHTVIGGIEGGETLYRLPVEARERQLSTISESGLRFVRTNLSWAEVQPQPGVFHWAQTDSFMAALAKHHLDWLVILAYSAPWAASQPGIEASPPAQLAAYLAYVRAVARRYGRNGFFWKRHPGLPKDPVTAFEVWNEPNSIRFWQPNPNPDAYAHLYLATRRVLHEVDPQVEAISAGLAPHGTQPSYSYIHAMFHAEPSLRHNLDAFGWHAYAPDAVADMAQVRSVRAILRKEGASNVPIELTEFGWPTAGFGAIPEATRADDLSTFARLVSSSDCGVGLVSAYAWLTPEENPVDNEDWYGLAKLQGTLKPSGLAYTVAVRKAADKPEAGHC